jgi:hypothetical protein
MDQAQRDALKKALQNANIQELLIQRFIDATLMSCDVSCYSGCAACCATGTANRAAQVE